MFSLKAVRMQFCFDFCKDTHLLKFHIFIENYRKLMTLVSYMYLCFLFQNAARIIRALFEITLRTGWPLMAASLLMLSKSIDRRLWAWENPLRQFSSLSHEILRKLEGRKLTVDKLREMDSKEIGRKILSHTKESKSWRYDILPNVHV